MPMKSFKQVALTANIFPTDADGHELSLASVNDLTSISGFELSANKTQVLSSVTDPLELSAKYPSVKAVKDALASIPIQDGVELSANKFQALSDVAPADLVTKYPSAAALSASLPTKVSQLENDSGYLTAHQSLTAYATKTELPKNVSELSNDVGYLSAHQSLTSYYTKDETEAEFATKTELTSKTDLVLMAPAFDPLSTYPSASWVTYDQKLYQCSADI